jgi:hypothetical protein
MQTTICEPLDLGTVQDWDLIQGEGHVEAVHGPDDDDDSFLRSTGFRTAISFHFDASAVPSDATIHDVRLRLRVRAAGEGGEGDGEGGGEEGQGLLRPYVELDGLRTTATDFATPAEWSSWVESMANPTSEEWQRSQLDELEGGVEDVSADVPSDMTTMQLEVDWEVPVPDARKCGRLRRRIRSRF